MLGAGQSGQVYKSTTPPKRTALSGFNLPEDSSDTRPQLSPASEGSPRGLVTRAIVISRRRTAPKVDAAGSKPKSNSGIPSWMTSWCASMGAMFAAEIVYRSTAAWRPLALWMSRLKLLPVQISGEDCRGDGEGEMVQRNQGVWFHPAG